VSKVRGITLNYKASQLVNFDTIKVSVLNGRSNSTVTVRSDKKIKRKRGDGACVSIVTETKNKIYKISFFKKRWRDYKTSVQFGYK
jgi:hypothetical protein